MLLEKWRKIRGSVIKKMSAAKIFESFIFWNVDFLFDFIRFSHKIVAQINIIYSFILRRRRLCEVEIHLEREFTHIFLLWWGHLSVN